MDTQNLIGINRARLGLDGPGPDRNDAAQNRLCVYGRMGPGGPDHHILEPLGGAWQAVTFPGFLQNGNACIADGECPGLAWALQGGPNHGQLLTSDRLTSAWTWLDDHEGEGYSRLLIPVTTASGEQIVANIYVSTDASRTQMMLLDGMNIHDDEHGVL